ncbi:MAG: hydrolase [Gemmatimonadaceae bacterium]|nr:hydrolase [Gemmatimonadaceae bacterium]
MTTSPYSPPWFLRNPHVQTIWGKFVRPEPPVPHVTRERWETPDDDSVTVVRLRADEPRAPRLVLFHGLEGNERSHYVQAFFRAAWRRGWGADLLCFRSCDGTLNRQPRFYHSGETGDASYVLGRLAAEHPEAALVACGVSLGGNVLVKLLGEGVAPVPPSLRAAVAVSVPYDLERGSRHISRGFSLVYERWFLRTLRAKSLAKQARYPDRFPAPDVIARIRTLWDFDDRITAPLHGFADAVDYYRRSSGRHFVRGIRVPTLCISAIDDPFLPRDVLDAVRHDAHENPAVTLQFEPHGGHVGFVIGPTPFRTDNYLAHRMPAFLDQHLGSDDHAAATERLAREAAHS